MTLGWEAIPADSHVLISLWHPILPARTKPNPGPGPVLDHLSLSANLDSCTPQEDSLRENWPSRKVSRHENMAPRTIFHFKSTSADANCYLNDRRAGSSTGLLSRGNLPTSQPCNLSASPTCALLHNCLALSPSPLFPPNVITFYLFSSQRCRVGSHIFALFPFLQRFLDPVLVFIHKFFSRWYFTSTCGFPSLVSLRFNEIEKPLRCYSILCQSKRVVSLPGWYLNADNEFRWQYEFQQPFRKMGTHCHLSIFVSSFPFKI